MPYKLKLPPVIIPSHVRTCYFDMSAVSGDCADVKKYKLKIPDMYLRAVSYEDQAAIVLYFPVKDGIQYISPFPNTYADNGEICLGEHIYGHVKDYKVVLDKIYNSVWYQGALSSWRAYCNNWADYARFLCEWERTGDVKLIRAS